MTGLPLAAARGEPPVPMRLAFGEADWVRRGAVGDKQALAAIVKAYQDRVYRLLLRLAGDPEVAADLTQETFLKAFAAIGGFRRGASLQPWLYRIANNAFIDHVRARRPASLDAWREESESAEPGALDGRIEGLADAEAIEEALGGLPATWRQAVVLRHFHDLPYEAISEVLGVPIGTVKTWIFRGRERLREALDQEGIRG